jgi:phosphate transport system permease protein
MIQSTLRIRRWRSRIAGRTFLLLTTLPSLIFLAVGAALLLRSWPILRQVSLFNLIFGNTWIPSEGKFGFLPFITGTLWVTTVAMVLSIPPCILTAIYLAEYARPTTRTLMKPLLDLLAAIPSVVYGVWGIVAIVPAVEYIGPNVGKFLGFIPFLSSKNPTGYSILAGGIVLAVMVTPFIIAVTYEVLLSVPQGLREASLAMGATQWETIKFAVLPPALPGIIAGVVLGSSRALGETMAVLMVVGNIAHMPHSIFDPAYPLPALIANNYGEMMSIPMYDAALLGAALVLLAAVLFFNILSTLVLHRITRKSWI